MVDPQVFLESAHAVTTLKMWPYFDIAYVIICCLTIKDDLQESGRPFSRKHPIACYFSTIINVYSGNFLSCIFLGEALLSPMRSVDSIILTTIVWYCMFYSPFDITYKLAKFLPINIVIGSMKEIYRAKKVYEGVSHAWKVFPNAWLILVFTGVVKVSGPSFIKLFDHLVRGNWSPNEAKLFESITPSFYTKSALLASIVFVLNKRTDIISAPHSLVFFCVAMFFVYFKVSSVLLSLDDPFVPFENLFCFLLFGGTSDALQTFVTGKKSDAESEQTTS